MFDQSLFSPGALMKNVDLEGSHMAGVNLRVATLKNANLQNCDLRGAVLAGSDLEVCNVICIIYRYYSDWFIQWNKIY